MKKKLLYNLLTLFLVISTILVALPIAGVQAIDLSNDPSPPSSNSAPPDANPPPSYQPYDGHHPTNEERDAAAAAALVARAQAKANLQANAILSPAFGTWTRDCAGLFRQHG